MDISWSHFLHDIENHQNAEATVELAGQGTFAKFRSKLLAFERPGSFPIETMLKFGVVPYYVTLRFENGVCINLYMRHVQEVIRKDGAVTVMFKSGSACRQNSISFNLNCWRRDQAG